MIATLWITAVTLTSLYGLLLDAAPSTARAAAGVFAATLVALWLVLYHHAERNRSHARRRRR